MLVLFFSTTDDFELELETVLRVDFLVFGPTLEEVRVDLDGKQSQSMDEQFIRNDRGVLVHENFMEGHGGYLGDDYTT